MAEVASITRITAPSSFSATGPAVTPLETSTKDSARGAEVSGLTVLRAVLAFIAGLAARAVASPAPINETKHRISAEAIQVRTGSRIALAVAGTAPSAAHFASINRIFGCSNCHITGAAEVVMGRGSCATRMAVTDLTAVAV